MAEEWMRFRVRLAAAAVAFLAAGCGPELSRTCAVGAFSAPWTTTGSGLDCTAAALNEADARQYLSDIIPADRYADVVGRVAGVIVAPEGLAGEHWLYDYSAPVFMVDSSMAIWVFEMLDHWQFVSEGAIDHSAWEARDWNAKWMGYYLGGGRMLVAYP